MKLNTVKRLALSGLLAASVTGGTLAPFVAGHASAEERCVKAITGAHPLCGPVPY